MNESLKDCTIGSLIVSAIVLIVSLIITLISKDSNWEFVILVPIGYFIASLFLFGYLAFSRSKLENNATMFVLATIFMTAGGWWLGHVLAFINVKLTEGIFMLITQRKN